MTTETNVQIQERIRRAYSVLSPESCNALSHMVALMAAEKKCSPKRLPKANLIAVLEEARRLYREERAHAADDAFSNKVLSSKEKFLAKKKAFLELNKSALEASKEKLARAKELAIRTGRAVRVNDIS